MGMQRWLQRSSDVVGQIVFGRSAEPGVAHGFRILVRRDHRRDRLLSAEELASVASFAFEVGTGCLDHSPGLEALLGRSSCATVDDLVQAVHLEDQKTMEAFLDLLRSPRDAPEETEVRNALGDRRIRCRAGIEKNLTGGGTWVVGVLQDVTERREREQYLLAEQKRLTDAQQVARIGTWEWISETGIIELSDITYSITGRSPREPVSYEEYLSRVFPEDREYVTQVWRELWRFPGKDVSCEHRYRCPDGITRVLRLHGAHVGDMRLCGRQGMLGTIQDVTEQRNPATRLQRFAALCQVSSLGMGIFDRSARLVEANDALGALLGYSLDHIHGRCAADLLHPEYPSSLIPGCADSDTDSASTVGEVALVNSSGDPVHCELHRELIAQEDGSWYWILVFRDITEHLKHAEELRYQATP